MKPREDDSCAILIRARTTRPAIDSDSDLIGIIHQVRRRWRMKLALRGAAIVAALAVVVLLAAALGLESLRFAPARSSRSASCCRSALLVLIGLVLRAAAAAPGDRRAGRALPRGARAVAAGGDHQRGRSEPAAPAYAVGAGPAAGRVRGREVPRDRRRAARRARAAARATPRRSPRWSSLAAIALFVLGPAYLRHALSALLVISRSVEAAAPYRIEVKPGNATVPQRRRPDDHREAARVRRRPGRSLMMRKTAGRPFERVPLHP